VRLDGQLLCNLAVSEDLQPVAQAAKYSAFEQEFRANFRAGIQLVQVSDIDKSIKLLIDRLKSWSVRKASMQRGLSALEVRIHLAALLVSFVAAGTVLTVTRPGPASDDLASMFRAFGWFQIV